MSRRPTMRMATAAALVAATAALVGAAATSAAAQTPGIERGAVRPGMRVTVVPSTDYLAGWFHRALFGERYRRLWATPIEVPGLDLATYGGGLRPVRRGGGKQTKSLRLEGPDGREYAFRSLDKDPSQLLPATLRATLVEEILQDQISASHPTAALVVTPLVQAAGLPTAKPALYVLPDDPALGEFRAEFAGMLGALEERPTDEDEERHRPGFEGARKVADTEELYERLDRDADERIDAREFLAARLLDFLVGDWDRHEDQWKWIKVGRGKRAPWRPVPYDRDQAFARYDGLLLDVARMSYPQLVEFGEGYSSTIGLGWNSRFLDRRLLSGLDAAAFDSVARALQAVLTDSAIDAAVRRLPPEHYALDGARLTRALERRRDGLPDAARRFYRFLAGEVNVYASRDAEVAVATRAPDGSLELTIAKQREAGEEPHEPFFRRRFRAGETKEIRLYLQGSDGGKRGGDRMSGADSVVIRGATGGPLLRVIGGGPLAIADSTGGVRVYATDPDVRSVGSRTPRIDRRPYVPPDSTDAIRRSPRDWGYRWRFQPWFSYSPDIGAFLGYGAAHYDFGFRKDPYASRLRLRAGYATGADAFRVDFLGDFRLDNSATRFLLYARASGVEVVRFFGFGNETPFTQPEDFYKVFQAQYGVTPAIGFQVGRAVLEAGPVLRYTTTDLDRPTLVAQLRPYGSAGFGQIGAQAAVTLDARDRPVASTRGAYLLLGGSVYPPLWDVVSTFGEVHGEVSTYVSPPLPLRPTLALRAGGQRVWGEFPFHEAAFVGGARTVRGLREQRYVGDASLYGNAELRFSLGRYQIVVPGEWGLFGLTDVGRVWLEGESSDTWHTAVGGGLWFAFLNPGATVSVAVARGEGRTAVYVRGGFTY